MQPGSIPKWRSDVLLPTVILNPDAVKRRASVLKIAGRSAFPPTVASRRLMASRALCHGHPGRAGARAGKAVKKSPESLSPRRRRGAEVRKY
jgi:hypothetical protein